MAPVSALCIAVIAGNSVIVLPTDTATLRWMHTVESSAWEEDYAADAGRLRLVEARVSRIGAGMEPPAGARRDGDTWRYVPGLPLLPRIDLANSADGGGYDLCWDGACVALNAIAPGHLPVALAAKRCAPASADPSPDGAGWSLR